MSIISRTMQRLITIFHSGAVSSIFDNVTSNTFDFIAAFPLFLYIINPLLVLPFAVAVQWRIYIVFLYQDFLQSILPGILVLYVLTWILLVGKDERYKNQLRLANNGSIVGSKHRSFSAGRESFHQPVYVLFLFAMLWMLLSICVNGWKDISLLGDATRHEGLLSYWGYIAVLFFLGSLIRNDTIKRWLCNISLGVSIAVAVFAIWQFYILPPDPTLHDAYPTGIFFQFNHYGYYLAIHILLAAALFTVAKDGMQRIIYLLAMAVNVLVLNVNNTFGAWLACCFGFLFMFIVYAVTDGKIQNRTDISKGVVLRRNWFSRHLNRMAIIPLVEFFGITVVVSFAGGFTGTMLASLVQFFTDVSMVAEDPTQADSAGTTRWMLWKLTAKYISERPLFGWGIEGIDNRLAEDTSYIVDGVKYLGSSRTHNEYLQYAATFGIPEAVAYTAACVGVFFRNVKHKKELKAASYVCLTAAFTYLVSACFGITMYNTAPFLFIFLGLGYRSDPHVWSSVDEKKQQLEGTDTTISSSD